jgi:hypothetical protein
MDGIKSYFNEHPFGVTFGVWGTVLGVTLLKLAKKQIPTNVKIIEARIIAQAGLLAGAAAFGLSSYLSEDSSHKRVKTATSSWKVRDFEEKPRSAAVAAAVATPLESEAAPAAAAELK